ncbi:MAG: thiolase family protein [Planctomycetota bacterium]|jgi:acetyl-CoA C-acetyltransferase
MQSIVVVAACRTPIGKFMGGLSACSAVELGTSAVIALLDRAGVPADDVEELIFGQARQLGSGPNPARQVAMAAGLPETTPAFTINKACGSGLKAIDLARASLLLEDRKIVVAGGMESMSKIPFLLPDMRAGYRLGHGKVLDGNYKDGFTCGILQEPMGMTAEYLSDDYKIGRDQQDEYALRSHQRAAAAQAAGRFKAEIAAVEVQDRRGSRMVEEDEHIRPDVTMAGLAKLPPVFRPDSGTVHAGNSSGITDAAAAVLLMTEEEAKRRGLAPMARLGASAVAGVSPRIMGIGPVPAMRRLSEKSGVPLADYPLMEVNEAFAAQMLACIQDLDLDIERLNVNGGAIALGHPIGATGARIAVTLIHEMSRREAERGIAGLCMSGGMGMALEFLRPVD